MIAIFVEGDSDVGFIDGLCRRLGIKCRVYNLGGNRPDKAVRKARAVAERSQLVVFLKDTHNLTDDFLSGFERKVYSDLEDLRREGNKIRVLRVIKSVESWILAGLCEQNPEGIDEPVTRLRSKLKGRIVKTEHFYRRLARKIDVEHAADRSESFREFLKVLRVLQSSS